MFNKLNFHSVKKAVASTTAPSDHPTEQADPAFDAALSEFTVYHQHITALDSSLASYARHYFDLFSSSNEIIVNMSAAITNNDATALRNTFATTRAAHAVLTGEREAELSNRMREDCIRPVADEMAAHQKLLTSIQRRHELARELDYYSGKLDALLKEKQDKDSRGKPVDMDKLERNQKKKDEAVSVYSAVNNEVLSQMHGSIANKGELLMQVWAAFESIERQVADLYASAVTGELSNANISSARSTSSSSRMPKSSSPVPSSVTVSLGMEGSDGSEPQRLSIQTPPPSYSAVAPPLRSPSPQPRSPQPPKDPPPPPKQL